MFESSNLCPFTKKLFQKLQVNCLRGLPILQKNQILKDFPVTNKKRNLNWDELQLNLNVSKNKICA